MYVYSCFYACYLCTRAPGKRVDVKHEIARHAREPHIHADE